MQTISVLTLCLPIVLIILPSLSAIVYGGVMILIMLKNKEQDKQKINEIVQQYIKTPAFFAFLCLLNGI